ncbi:hypothetical protein EU557_18865 [Hymenobacter wooponensis]|uniref:Uncharacterized protein n=2 Tax=Hymenobacter wooponensis TaxID=1525360 RepID=A0A4Z0MGV5_9BACT|nr:hypothetical protein EU557_18865 [Hymenobacter wooponensis]
MLTQEFFTLLEYTFTHALAESDNEELRRYWCDGVLYPEWEEEYLPQHVTKSKEIILRAWMEGRSGKKKPLTHQIHPLHLGLGKLSLKTYLRGQDLSKWIIEGIDPTWVTLDEKGMTFFIQLP